jgi:hypothetical protein
MSLTDKNENVKFAIIFGITGQDGSYLAELLLSKNYHVIGVMRRSSSFNTGRIDHIRNKLELIYGDVTDTASVIEIINKYKPDEIYNLAAQSFVQTSWTQPVLTGEFTALGLRQRFFKVGFFLGGLFPSLCCHSPTHDFSFRRLFWHKPKQLLQESFVPAWGPEPSWPLPELSSLAGELRFRRYTLASSRRDNAYSRAPSLHLPCQFPARPQ